MNTNHNSTPQILKTKLLLSDHCSPTKDGVLFSVALGTIQSQ